MRVALCVLVLLLGANASADIVSETIEETELTIYRDPNRGPGEAPSLNDHDSNGIAMVTETRTIEIPAGASTIQFRGVADGIVPQTAKLDGVAATIVEANFDYNLLAPGSLVEKSLGRPVRLIRTNRDNGSVEERRGILRSGPDGVVIDFGDSVEALNCSGLDERLVFEDVPQSLQDKPTLSLSIRSPSAGRHRVQLSYLALGMDWSADYVARVHPDGKRMDVSGWITLVNRYRSSFAAAKTHVVAGKLAREEDATVAPEFTPPLRGDRCWMIGDFARRQRDLYTDRMFRRSTSSNAPVAFAAAEQVVVTGSFVARESQLGDYKLYTLPFPTTVESRQMKQARLLERPDVRFERSYEYRLSEDVFDNELQIRPARLVLRLKNTRRDGLGLPLPAGTFRLMETASDGRQYFVGEDAIDDTAVDLPLRFELGESNDVTVSTRAIENGDERGVIEIEIGNAGADTAQVRIVHSRALLANARIVRESHRHLVEDGDYVWSLRVGARKRAVLRYTLAPDERGERANED